MKVKEGVAKGNSEGLVMKLVEVREAKVKSEELDIEVKEW